MGHAAAVVGGRWGAVSPRAQAGGGRREAVDQPRRSVEQAVARAPSRGPCDDEGCAEPQRWRAAPEALWAVWTATDALPEAKPPACAAPGSAMGVRWTQMVTWCAILMAQGRVPSRAPVGRWVAQTPARAGGLVAVLDQACQALVMLGGLEAMVLPHAPVLVAVEPHRRAWVAGPRGPDRTGETWCAVRKAWPNVERVGSDAGTGLARGVKRRHAARAPTSTALEPPTSAPVPSGFEVLHTARERPRGVRRRWAGAATRFETAAKADEQVAQAPRHGIAARAAAGRARPAWHQAARVVAHAEQAEQARARSTAAWALRRPEGPRKARAWAPPQRTDPRGALAGDAWGNVRRRVGAVRTLHHVDGRPAPLAPAVPEPWRREAGTRWRYGRGPMERTHGIRQAQATPLVLEAQRLCQRLSPEGPTASARVGPRRRHTVRASRAGEWRNRVRRMHQGRHRHGSQGRLDLQRVCWHGRPFLHGKRRGACPYQRLGLNLPTDAWWERFQMEPEAFRRKLSTQEVAA